MNDGYLGNPLVLRAGVAQEWSPERIKEYRRCRSDPLYFIENHCKIIHVDRGLVPFAPYEYQKKMIRHFDSTRFSIVLACRQSGKSITSVAYLLWYALFKPDQTIAILANKEATAKEMLARVTLMLEHTPKFLQAGCKALNKKSIEFENNSRIFSAATSSSSIRGQSCSMIFLDELAFVDKASEFYTSTYPVISSGKESRVIITSTANGVGNLFNRLWTGAQQGTNKYKPFQVNWHDVPGRDEAWRAETISNTSEMQFEQEYGNSFLKTGNSLIDADTLMQQKTREPLKVYEDGRLNCYVAPLAGHTYVMTVDSSKGVGGDYSAFSVIDVTRPPFEQVAVYRNNQISPHLFADVIHQYAILYNQAYVVIESNDHGAIVCSSLYNDIEYENVYVESVQKASGIGVHMNRRSKSAGCSTIKELIEASKIKVYDAQTIIEMSTFVVTAGSFAALRGNTDDIMMTLVLFGYVASTTWFSDLTNMTLKDIIKDAGGVGRVVEVSGDDDALPPIPIIDDGMGGPEDNAWLWR